MSSHRIQPTNRRFNEIWKDTGIGKHDVDQDEKEKDLTKRADDNPQDNMFDIEEIQIEELAVDGICGVY
jgi:mycofactocin precursor